MHTRKPIDQTFLKGRRGISCSFINTPSVDIFYFIIQSNCPELDTDSKTAIQVSSHPSPVTIAVFNIQHRLYSIVINLVLLTGLGDLGVGVAGVVLEFVGYGAH